MNFGNGKAIWNENSTRTCNRCKKEYPATTEYFNRNKEGLYGLNLPCKQCLKEYNHKRYLDNREKSLRVSKLYQLEHQEALHIYCKEYYHKNKEADHARCKRYANTERGREIINFSSRTRSAWRRKMLKKLKKDFTLQDWKDCLEYFDNRCAYCGKPIDNLTIDHFIPVSSFGETIKSNIIPACQSCNSSKNKHDFDEWYITQEFYDDNKKQNILKFISLGCD